MRYFIYRSQFYLTVSIVILYSILWYILDTRFSLIFACDQNTGPTDRTATQKLQLHKLATKLRYWRLSNNWSECSNEIFTHCILQSIWLRIWTVRNWTTCSVLDRRALVATHEDGPRPFHDVTTCLIFLLDPWSGNRGIKYYSTSVYGQDR